jgi:hypothetical protein
MRRTVFPPVSKETSEHGRAAVKSPTDSIFRSEYERIRLALDGAAPQLGIGRQPHRPIMSGASSGVPVVG